MKKLTLFFLMLCSFGLNAQQTANKTLVKTLNIGDLEVITVNLDGNVQTQFWDDDNAVRVQMEIIYKNADLYTMKYLIMKGRYDIQLSDEDPSLIIQPNYKKNIPINAKGDLLIESISYTIFIPKNVKLIDFNNNEAATIAENENK